MAKKDTSRKRIIPDLLKVKDEYLFKVRPYRRHYQIITVDMTQQKYGIPKITFTPRGKQTLAYPYNVRVHVKTKFEDKEFEVDVAGFKITQTTGSLW